MCSFSWPTTFSIPNAACDAIASDFCGLTIIYEWVYLGYGWFDDVDECVLKILSGITEGAVRFVWQSGMASTVRCDWFASWSIMPSYKGAPSSRQEAPIIPTSHWLHDTVGSSGQHGDDAWVRHLDKCTLCPYMWYVCVPERVTTATSPGWIGMEFPVDSQVCKCSTRCMWLLIKAWLGRGTLTSWTCGDGDSWRFGVSVGNTVDRTQKNNPTVPTLIPNGDGEAHFDSMI